MNKRKSVKVSPRFIMTLILAVLLTGAGAALAATADVGMITGLTGKVTYWNQAEEGQPAPVQAFMKVRLGDKFKLPGNAVLKVLYFDTGRQETWTGPVLVTAGAGAGEAAGGGKPAVKMLPTKLTGKLKAAPLPLPRSNFQFAGVIRTMNGQCQTQRREPVVCPSPEKARREIAYAHRAYRKWRQKAEATDFTPEMYLLSVLAEYGRYREMDRLIIQMRGAKPGDPALKQLQVWVQKQMAAASRKPAGSPGQE